MLGDDQALGVAHLILGHDRHASAQQLARRRVSQPAQRVHTQPLGLRPVGGGGQVQLGPDGEEHGFGYALFDIPGRTKAGGERLNGLRVDHRRAQGHDCTDLDIVEVAGHDVWLLPPHVSSAR